MKVKRVHKIQKIPQSMLKINIFVKYNFKYIYLIYKQKEFQKVKANILKAKCLIC